MYNRFGLDRACMYLYMYMCMHICTYLCMYICLCTCMYVFLCLCLFIYLCLYLCMYVDICIAPLRASQRVYCVALSFLFPALNVFHKQTFCAYVNLHLCLLSSTDVFTLKSTFVSNGISWRKHQQSFARMSSVDTIIH